jgi:tRNA modification GTPase
MSVICAPATRTGGAIAVVRVSGEGCLALIDNIFTAKNHQPLTAAKPYTLHYGEIKDSQGNTLDDVLISVFHAPNSYTGEESAEISCHGSQYITNAILQLLIDNGCRMAQPGEYTRRAYLNGKMDLSQAEAVADLIAANNKATHHLAMSQLKGHFSSELSKLREQLLKMTSLLELELDFSDHEELQFADRTELIQLARHIDDRVSTLAHSFMTGNALKKGIPVAIVGKTNVGKSTLLNQLFHEDKAIVSDIDGTTRDTVEDTMLIHGITFRFIDTAGIRHTDDRIEQLGIERSYQKMDEASIIVWLVDHQPSDEEASDIAKRIGDKPLILVHNKVDLTAENQTFSSTGSISSSSLQPAAELSISAKYGQGIEQLEDAIFRLADIPELTEDTVIITNSRHYDALIHAHEALDHVLSGLTSSLPSDLVAEDLRQVLQILGDITGGAISSQETLNNIFQHFCIGK